MFFSVLISETKSKGEFTMRKVKIMAQAMLDLTRYDAKALSKIKSITSVAAVFLPKDPPEGFMEAYAAISKKAIAAEIAVSDNVCMFNGTNVITKNDLQEGSVIVINGVGILSNIPAEMNISVIANGTLFVSSSAKVNVINANGIAEQIVIPDDAPIKTYTNKLTLNAKAVSYFEQNTVIVCCNKIFIENDVTADMLDQKNLMIISLNRIIAEKKLHSYLAAKAKIIDKMLTPEEYEENEKALYGKKRRKPWKK